MMPSVFRIKIMVDVEDQHIVDKHTWHIDANGYVSTTIDGFRVTLHRLVKPELPFIDHRNGNKLDCTRNNLRESTQSTNGMNRKLNSNSTSGYKGVSWSKQKQKWKADIAANSRRIFLGLFSTAQEAATAYNEAALKYHGEFARLNKIEE